eukprot:gene1002-595_t
MKSSDNIIGQWVNKFDCYIFIIFFMKYIYIYEIDSLNRKKTSTTIFNTANTTKKKTASLQMVIIEIHSVHPVNQSSLTKNSCQFFSIINYHLLLFLISIITPVTVEENKYASFIARPKNPNNFNVNNYSPHFKNNNSPYRH